jgi:AraC-like DNA-binding protein
MPFTFEERPSDSSLVQAIWRTQSEQAGSFISIAAIHWEMVLMKYKGKTSIVVRGPETRATSASFPADAEWLGITFRLGAYMPKLPPSNLLDRHDVDLPEATGKSFWLHGATWEFPTYENADAFVMKLEREGLLKHDPVVDAVRQCHPQALSKRSIQYRFLRATGLTQAMMYQIKRARRAAALLECGMPIIDTVRETGYFDQAHLTNALKRFIGQTPTQIVRAKTAE